MTELRLETITLPAADLGPENPFPALHGDRDLHAVEAAPDVPADMVANMRYGHVPSILPYTLQDGYSRQRKPTEFKVAVLENEILRATFMLDFGGRLRSLYHKPNQRELLSANPVFQPANLALRNAWFSGGVEWNIGTIGHTPLTCAPLFAARVESDGIPILRMYEWERIRQVTYQIDASLPPGSPVLLVRIRIVNPHDHTVPMYWWSNMAVPETPDTRVLVPATSTYKFDYTELLRVLPVPQFEGVDKTYSTNSRTAVDYFFHLPDGQRPWIAALDGQGKGLVQVSSERLKGRKLFVWGTGSGGKHWQDFLSVPGAPYLEIQAGLARTQLEHLRMPARTGWSWLEAYGLLEADPAAVHGKDWSAATQAVEKELERLFPATRAQTEAERFEVIGDRKPLEILHRGSGWGALERLRREKNGEPPLGPRSLDFDDASLGEAQQPWLDLLNTNLLPLPTLHTAPAYMVQDEWRHLLEKSRDLENNWYAQLQLGVMYYYGGDGESARRAWDRSRALNRTAIALRNLAILDLDEQKLELAMGLYTEACKLEPGSRPLLVEALKAMLAINKPDRALALIQTVAEPLRSDGHIKLLEAQAALAAGDLNRTGEILAHPFIVDTLREGEANLTSLWFTYHEQRISAAENIPIGDALRRRVRKECPLPEEFDFRMSDDDR